MADLIFVGQFVASKVGATGLTVTVDIDRYTISSGSRVALVTGGSATEGRRGLYHYRLASADLALYQYVCTFLTADTGVDQQEMAALGLVVPDALVSSVPTAEQNRAEMDAHSAKLSTIDSYVGLIYTLLTNVSNRVGAWTGSGVNTVLGAFKALLSKTASAPSDIGGTFDPATDSVEALRDRGDAAWATADVSGLATAAALATVDGIVDDILVDTGTTIPGLLAAELSSSSDSTTSGAITRTRGNTWTINATIGAITGYTSLWFTAKWDRDDPDISSVLQIKLNSPSASDGLLYVNGAAASDSAKGSITVSDDTTGAIIIAVDETITQYLPPAGLYYDIQVLNSGTVTTPDSGTLTITADVTRSVT